MSSKKKWSVKRTKRVRRLIPYLFGLVDELNDEFAPEKRKFTPDGHMVGSIGEVVAAYAFNLDLLPMSTRNHDAQTVDGNLVQITDWRQEYRGPWRTQPASRTSD